jgi:hypothetical protein
MDNTIAPMAGIAPSFSAMILPSGEWSAATASSLNPLGTVNAD